jgi:hypothetical protein
MTNLLLLLIVGLLVAILCALCWPTPQDLKRAFGGFAEGMRFLFRLGLVVFCVVLLVELAWRVLTARVLWPAGPVVLCTLAIIFGPATIFSTVLRRVRRDATRLSPTILVVPRSARPRPFGDGDSFAGIPPS